MAGLCAAGARAAENPIGIHSMIQLNAPPAFMQAMFAEAAGIHAGSIRLDIAPAFVFGRDGQPPDYSGLDEVISLARQYHLRVVGDLFTVPWWIADCQGPTDLSSMDRCGTDDLTDYRWMIAQIVGHSTPVIRDWEIWNEPDSSSFFSGTPTQYAQMLRAAHDAIKQTDPGANVLLGGLSDPGGAGWLAQVFAVPGADAEHAFDIANVHERSWLDSVAGDIATWRQFFAEHDFTGPLWVTEHGYPSDGAYQYDPSYRAGPESQAAFLSASIPSLLDAGASAVFVTERDNLSGQFASEGVIGGDVADPPVEDPQVVEKPAFAVVRRLADCYVALGRDCPGAAPFARPPVLAPAPRGSTVSAPVAVSDHGPGPLQLGRATVGDPFAVESDGCDGRLLEPNQTCTVVLRFTPVAGGWAAGMLLLPSDNGRLSLPVIGVSPSASALRFSSLRVSGPDGLGHPQRLTLRVVNPLSAPVGVSAVRLSGHEFSLLADHCARIELAPGASCRVVVRYMGARLGTAHAVLTLTGEGTSLVVPLDATAYRLPAVTLVSSTAVMASEPSLVRWRVRRMGGFWSRSGEAFTAPRTVMVGGERRYVARLRLRLAPGTYRFTVTASNGHGTSPPKRLIMAG